MHVLPRIVNRTSDNAPQLHCWRAPCSWLDNNYMSPAPICRPECGMCRPIGIERFSEFPVPFPSWIPQKAGRLAVTCHRCSHFTPEFDPHRQIQWGVVLLLSSSHEKG